jgi:hypothetical protein
MRTLLVPALLLLAAAPAAAQDVIHPGQSVTGELARSDPTMADSTHYDVWRFRGEAAHHYRILLRSDEFDAFLTVGSTTVPGCDDCSTDDDGGGGTDAQVEYWGAEGGTFEIRAYSFDGGRTGRYELTLVDDGIHEEHEEGTPAVAGTPIALGTVSGELARGDVKMGHSYVDTWTYQGHAGEVITITVHSDAFDTLLEVGAYDGGECSGMDANDDSGGGTDSRLTLRLPEDGAYHLHVSAAQDGGAGAYTVTVEPVADVPAVPSAVEVGATMEGFLSDDDARDAESGGLYDLWTFRGQAGETVRITMQSPEFDTYVHFGRTVNGRWEALDANDDADADGDGDGDGAEGTDSELVVTLAESGEYHVRASSFMGRGTGPYTLRVERQ